ncbi:MAG: adenylate/guanylate cyclase domain-containing protein [Bdellovibrionota bacterium]
MSNLPDSPEKPSSVSAKPSLRSTSGEPPTIVFDVPLENLSPDPLQPALGTFTSWRALASAQNGFAEALAPLTPQSFEQVIHEVEDRLKIVNRTLGMLHGDLDVVLAELLRAIQMKLGELLRADRVTVFLLDAERNDLWTHVPASGPDGKSMEIRVPLSASTIVSEAARTRQSINIPFDLFEDPRSAESKRQYERTGYRSYNLLARPLTNESGELIAVIQLLNKVTTFHTGRTLEQRIDKAGFTKEDERLFDRFAPCMRLILESSTAFHTVAQKQSAGEALMKSALSMGGSLDLHATLKRVMIEAKKLMNADRSTLWLLDKEKRQLWTEIEHPDGSSREMRIGLGNGFAGRVGLSGEVLNIPFDLYDHELSEFSRQADQQNQYRTCSLLCMPVFDSQGQLIAVTQLVNKRQRGDLPEYNPADWPKAPDIFRASFTKTDEEFMRVFNIQAGIALENAMLFAKVREQQQIQADILRSLSDSVISIDAQGNIVGVNDRARELLGCDIGSPEKQQLEGRSIFGIVRTGSPNFDAWIAASIQGNDERSNSQYYPDQTIHHANGEQRTVNVSINRMRDAATGNTRGALIVMGDVSHEKRLKSTLYRYMTQELAEQLIQAGNTKMGGDRREVSVLFSDIRNYTGMTEKMDAEEVVQFLNEYFEIMVESVFDYKGTLDKYIGDAIMAVYGSPLAIEDHAWMAVQTSLEMRRRLSEFNIIRRRFRSKSASEVPPVIKIGIGINSDTVISGNIGCARRMEFTAIGDGVNLSSRLESASKAYGCDILLSQSTYRKCADRIWARELDVVRVKGKTEPIAVYELIGGRSDPIPEAKQQVLERYSKARQLYLSRSFAQAQKHFEGVLEIDPDDKSSKSLMERCRQFLAAPPGDDWDGTWTMLEK